MTPQHDSMSLPNDNTTPELDIADRFSELSTEISNNNNESATTNTIENGTYRGIEKTPSPCIEFEQALAGSPQSGILVDTRTPKEYNEAHVYNAVNVPLMSNYERHIIGLTYHKESKDAAIRKGWELFSPIIQQFLEGFEMYRDQKVIYVYCWRGGMRSRIVTNLLRMNGYNAIQVTGGFKRYMNDIVWKSLNETFPANYPPKFIVLFGNSGNGKTIILKELQKRGMPVIDLEGLAGHKGSLYGGVDTTPQTQKMFSIHLYHELEQFKDSPYIFVEGEANKIGNVFLPDFVYTKIMGDLKVDIKASIETRVKYTRAQYCTTGVALENLHEATACHVMVRNIGTEKVSMLRGMLDDEDFDGFVEWLLLNYYDLRYRHSKAGYSYEATVSSDDLEACCTELIDLYHSLTKQINVNS